jgi:predicted alpha/beta hydrolase family esterase
MRWGACRLTSVLLGSRRRPLLRARARAVFAHCWGAQFMDYGDCGHINADSGLGSWPEGHVLLQDLMKD